MQAGVGSFAIVALKESRKILTRHMARSGSFRNGRDHRVLAKQVIPAAEIGLALFNRAAQGGIDGKSAVFKLSMDGYQDLAFSFAVQRPVSMTNDYGVSLFTFSYSTDGTTFFPWGAIDTGFSTSVINQPYALGSILQFVNDADTVFIKMTVSGSTGGINSARIDNVQFNATAIPEPASIAILLSGFGILGASRRRVRIA